MNPYNQQHPYNFQQHTPGPPQPQWQAPPRRGWGDPRPQGHQHQPSGPQSPISPFQSAALGYHPHPPPPPPPPWGPHPPQQAQPNQHDTSSWGVKYNHSPQPYQQEEQRPPLPPRPTSAASQASPKHEHVNATGPWQQSYGTTPGPPLQQQTQWAESCHSQGQLQPPSHEIPPPPPPRPPQYQAQLQAQHQPSQLPHDHYSHQPPTHHYDPSAQNFRPDVQQSSHNPHSSIAFVPFQSDDHPPVSPIDQNDAHFYSSALGTGGPSDWEHFGGPSAGMSPDSTSPPPRMEATATPGFDTPMQMKPQPDKENSIQHIASTTFESPAPMYVTPAPQQRYNQAQVIQRRDSDDSSIINDGMKRAGTIDSVIQAWNTPLQVPAKTEASADPRPASQPSDQRPPTPAVQDRIVEVEKVVEKIVDPYDDLEPEVKASLKRYVAMLRKESAADTDEEKFSMFENFVVKELRLRSMIYGVEPKLQMLKEGLKPASAETSANNVKPMTPLAAVVPEQAPEPPREFRPLESQPIKQPVIQTPEGQVPPSLPPIAASQVQATSQQEKAMEPPRRNPQAYTGTPQPAPVSEVPRPTTPAPVQAPPTEMSPQSRDGFVMVDAGDDEPEYSPGGRPRVKRPTQINTTTIKPPSPAKPPNSRMSPGADAPMVLEDYVMPGPPSPGANAPMIVEPNSATDLPQVVTPSSTPLIRSGHVQPAGSRPNSVPTKKFEPARPAYTPFKYNASVETPRLPADQSYSSLRNEAVDSGRLLVHKPSLPASLEVSPERSSTPSRRVQDEAFIGLIRLQSKAVRKKTPDLSSLGPPSHLRPGTPARASTPLQQPAMIPEGNDIPTTTVALRHFLPDSVPDSYGLSHHAKANSVKAAIDGISDSFGFIHELVLDWDRKNREVRKKLDEERSLRQADSEQHIDDLFNDNEIGYADIGNLESDFNLAEAEKKYQEDQQELESFTQRVYTPVTSKLQKELAELNAQYTIAVDLLDLESESASRMLKSSALKAEMAFVMSCVLSAFNKLELRHQKIAEANVERERRRKRLELTVLYTNGDMAGVRSLEAEFAVAEKMQVLHEARGKDTRANKLMDTFDRATVRGLGDNQTYVDDLLVRIRELKELVLKDANQIPESVYQADGLRESLSMAQKATEFVLADSQKLLTISNVADIMLNEADFAVSVAEAKVSNAESSVYEKLASEKEKEDQKIVEDTNIRMASIAKGPEEASALIKEVTDRVGDDPMHKDRMKAALEAAKRRNASKEGGNGGMDGAP